MRQLNATVELASGTTWYKITGKLDGVGSSLLVLHGAPGSTHDYLDAFTDLADCRAVIHYDQIGNGGSDLAKSRRPDDWTVGLFLRQLDELIKHLCIGGRYGMLGHSWGGMLAAEHASRCQGRTPGARSWRYAGVDAALDRRGERSPPRAPTRDPGFHGPPRAGRNR